MDLHPTDRAEIYKELNKEQREFVHKLLVPKELGEIFEQLDTEEQEQLLEEVDEQYAESLSMESKADVHLFSRYIH